MKNLSLRVPLILFLFSLAFVIRANFLLNGPTLESLIWSDMKAYVRVADDMAKNNWHPYVFFQSAGYPYFIYFLKSLSDRWPLVLNVIQALASFLTLVPIYFMTRPTLGKWTAVMSLFLGAIHLNWILMTNFALPETFFTLLLSFNAWFGFLLVRKVWGKKLWALLWGLTFIGSFWLKGTYVLFGPMFFMGLFFLHGKQSISVLCLIALVVSSGLVAHGLVTYKTIGKFQMSASTKGLNFVEGKCPSKVNEDSLHYYWHSPLYTELGINHYKKWKRPFTDADYFTREGLKCIKKNPLVLLTSFEAIPYLFLGNKTWPLNQTQYKNGVRIYELFMAIFMIVGLCLATRWILHQDNRKELVIMWLFPVLSLFLCVYIFKSEMRYRIPFDIWFIPLGVKGWGELLQRHSLKTIS